MILVGLPSRMISHLWTTTCLPLGAAPLASLCQRGCPSRANSADVPSAQTLCASAGQSHPDSIWFMFSLYSDLFSMTFHKIQPTPLAVYNLSLCSAVLSSTPPVPVPEIHHPSRAEGMGDWESGGQVVNIPSCVAWGKPLTLSGPCVPSYKVRV